MSERTSAFVTSLHTVGQCQCYDKSRAVARIEKALAKGLRARIATNFLLNFPPKGRVLKINI